VATDSDLPAQTLTFTLDPGAPAGASINPTNGLFTWGPAIGHTPMTNLITVTVMDDGDLNLSDSKTFTAIVVAKPRITSITVEGGVATVTWSAFPDKDYQVKVSDDLVNWSDLGNPVTADGSTVTITEAVGANQNRFYKIVQLD
jgi:hypothetical protein